ncbi:MAG: NAD-dependent epimerase/dehydratase family protein, partial [Syntrophales bacterium]|nr:NAD-dependent epimerase/dehydratase family protein [Syntrophales bacterium]
TGAAGFVGRALYSRLTSGNVVIGVDVTSPPDGALNIAWEQADLTDGDSVTAICEKHSPDVVIHCARPLNFTISRPPGALIPAEAGIQYYQ